MIHGNVYYHDLFKLLVIMSWINKKDTGKPRLGTQPSFVFAPKPFLWNQWYQKTHSEGLETNKLPEI